MSGRAGVVRLELPLERSMCLGEGLWHAHSDGIQD